MSADTFTGLRPVNKRSFADNLHSQTRRIVLPSSTSQSSAQPPVVEAPPVVVPMQKPVIKKRFKLVPGVPSLVEALPNGIPFAPGWLFIGSNPSMDLAAFTAVVLHIDGISKVHAAITEHSLKPFVTDMGSTNGTRITRGQETLDVHNEPVELQAEDILWLGPAFFKVVQI